MQNNSGGDITYEWTGPNGFDTTYTNNNYQNYLGDLFAGQYILHYTDSIGCKGVHFQNMIEPEELKIEEYVLSEFHGAYEVSCFDANDGSIELTSVVGGHDYSTSGYSFDWLTIEGTQISDTLSRNQYNLGSGVYSVAVSDSLGCMVLDTFEMVAPDTIHILESLSTSLAGNYNMNCSGDHTGTIRLDVTGGDASGYTFHWDHTSSTASELFNLAAGEYRVTVTDGMGCQQKDTILLTQPDPLQIDSVLLSDYQGYAIACEGNADGTIDLAVTGGVPYYTYQWKKDGILIPEDTSRLDQLGAGLYSVVVADSNLCELHWSVELIAPQGIDISFDITNVSCTGSTLGVATALVSGGVEPYGYFWDEGGTLPTITGLNTGNYPLVIRDANLCIALDTAIIEQNTNVEIDIEVSDSISCHGMKDGILRAEPTGGISPYSFVWTDGPASQIFSNLGEGSYTVTVTDHEGCTGVQSIFLNDPDSLLAVFSITDTRCFGTNDGEVALGSQGGTGSVKFYWNGSPVGTNQVDNLLSGTYQVKLVDASNCTSDTFVVVGQPDKLRIHLDARYTVYPFCPDWHNGTLALSVRGGVRDYQYNWTGFPAETDSILSEINEDSYSVRVIDSHSCVADTTFRLRAVNDVCLGIPTAFTPNNDGENDYWDISYINETGGESTFFEVYPKGLIHVYDRLGNMVFSCSGGCAEPWRGEDNRGKALPVDSYFYVIDLNTGEGPSILKGTVTIIR
jgi:gliding motility-associated-like protein